MSGEAEPRRSVRATKGQHTKSFDEIEPVTAPKRRQTKKTKKAQEQEQSQEPEEIIRCVCGATEQDEDSGEAWISCETCFVWQHNVCVGVSSFEDEIPENYWCEKCRPQDHKELLDDIAKGDKPWDARRKAHEVEEAERKKKRGGRKPKGKRTSDPKDAKDAKEELDKETTRSKSKASPTPETLALKDKKEAVVAKQGKRKSREDSHDGGDGKSTKLRRVSERDAVPVSVKYTPPADLAASISELPGTRVGPAKALRKSLSHVLTSMTKNDELDLSEGETEESMAEKHALQIERAVFDTHPVAKGHKEYSQQIKSLTFNLKNNPELCRGLLGGAHSAATLAVMTSEQLASAEMQRQTAEMRARAEKQSILYTQDTGPRVRRTHKGEEVVEDENLISDAPIPMAGGPRRGGGTGAGDQHAQLVKRESVGGDQGVLNERLQERPTSQGSTQQQQQQQQETQQQQSPSEPNFDINKVFSTVKSPAVGHNRRPSAPAVSTNGPGFDPDVDRMLQDDNESPPYSPTEEAHDPDVVWRGSLAMSSIADFQATAKHIGGANFAICGPWSKLIPRRLTVAGRIPQQSAIEYLCSLRYSTVTDIVVVSILPASPDSQQEFYNLVNYFISKKRYGVVGNKVAGNVRDTYLVPVPPGEDGHPEFMYNLVDNYIPKSRTEPMLLAVFVYRSDPEQLRQILDAAAQPPTPTPPPPPHGGQRSSSTSGPAFSPATPQGAFAPPPAPPQPPQPQPPAPQQVGGPVQSTTPVPIPQPLHSSRPTQVAPAAGVPTPSQSPPATPAQMTEAQKYQAQLAGQAMAQEVLGASIGASTAQFLLPQAFQMSRREWEVIRDIYERDPRARDDLNYLGLLLEKEGAEMRADSRAGAAHKPT